MNSRQLRDRAGWRQRPEIYPLDRAVGVSDTRPAREKDHQVLHQVAARLRDRGGADRLHDVHDVNTWCRYLRQRTDEAVCERG